MDKQKQRIGVLPQKGDSVKRIILEYGICGLFENSKHSMWLSTCEKVHILERQKCTVLNSKDIDV